MSLFSSFLGSITGSNQRKATNQAVAAQNGQIDKAIAAGQAQFDQTRTDQLPFITAGQHAVGAQGDLLGLNGNEAQAAAVAGLKSSPLFTALFGTGQDAVLANAAATGGLRGGNVQTALARNGEDVLAQIFQNQIGNLGQVAGQGTNTAAGVGALGANNATNAGNAFINQGNNTAGGILSNANSMDQMWGNLLGNFGKTTGLSGGGSSGGMGNILQSLFGGGGSSGLGFGGQTIAPELAGLF